MSISLNEPEHDEYLSDMIGDLDELRDQLEALGDKYDESIDSCDEDENCALCACRLANYSAMEKRVDLMEKEIERHEAGPEREVEDFEF